jgi:hypothetical protein
LMMTAFQVADKSTTVPSPPTDKANVGHFLLFSH